VYLFEGIPPRCSLKLINDLLGMSSSIEVPRSIILISLIKQNSYIKAVSLTSGLRSLKAKALAG
jgi:hypothetical protein